MTVLITGAAGGIGRAAAEQCEGLDVVGQDVRSTGARGPWREMVPGDLRDTGTLNRLRKALAGNPLDALVLAHGVAGPGRVSSIGDDEIRRIMSINFESVVSAWDFFRDDLERSCGVLIVVSSQAALTAEADNGIYCASKSALLGWSRGMERQTGVRLRVLCPGATETPLLRQALEGMAEAQGITYETILARRNRAVPAGRLGTPEEMGAAVRWLMDLESPRLITAAVTGGEVLT